VRTHPESGRHALFVNALFTTRVLGMPTHESDALLKYLYKHITQPQFTCRFRWRPDSVIVKTSKEREGRSERLIFRERRRSRRTCSI
jgi:taurine dioxygenase